MINKHKVNLSFLMAVFLMTFLSGCGAPTTGNKSEDAASKTSSSTNQDLNADNGLSGADIEKQKSLGIGPGCVGCNRCIKFDPEHFGPNSQGIVPEVLSQENLDSAALATAIRNCPVSVIAVK